MNPELYSEQEQQQEQQKNQNEIEVCTYRTCIYAEKTYWLEWAMC